MAEPGAELARDVVACPGADTCNLAVTQSRGLAAAIGDALEKAGLAEVGGVRINISGCTNSCGQHHIADIGFFGLERRAHGRAAPGYQMLLGGHVGDMQIEFGEKATRLPAKRAPRGRRAGGRAVRRRARRRRDVPVVARPLRRRQRRSATTLEDLDEFPTPEDGARVLRRLRRDRSVRRRDRRRRSARHEPRWTPTTQSTQPLVDVRPRRARRGVGRARAQARVGGDQVGVGDASATGVVLAASFQDCVLIDVAAQVVARHRGRVPRHAVPLRRDALVRRAGARALRPQPADDHAADRARRPLADRSRRVLRDAQGRAARPRARGQGGVDDRPAPRRSADACERTDRRLRHRPRHREGQPDRHLDRRRHRRLHRRPRPARAPARATRATRRSAAGRAPAR